MQDSLNSYAAFHAALASGVVICRVRVHPCGPPAAPGGHQASRLQEVLHVGPDPSGLVDHSCLWSPSGLALAVLGATLAGLDAPLL